MKEETLFAIQKSIDDEIRPDLKDVRERFFVLEGKTANMFQTASPVELLAKGKEFLEKTGLEAYIDAHFDQFFAYCSENLKMKTAYDIQNSIFDYFETVELEKEFEKTLKEFAYQEGISLDVARRIGAIYLRNRTLERLKMHKEDIDLASNQN